MSHCNNDLIENDKWYAPVAPQFRFGCLNLHKHATQRKPLEKNDKPSQSHAKVRLNDYSSYGHLTHKDEVSKIAGKIYLLRLSFGVPTFRIVGYQTRGQSFSAWEMRTYFLESHWCCPLQLPSADFLQSSPCIPLSTAHELKTTDLSETKTWFQTQNNECQWEE